ncbi:MAG: hypothetical protein KKF89_01955 [Nanoarchaeota archaeon]|nr:hypothetical protein [Nanoarchaeota archaeon]MBU1854459.1 hypothetical protein [Nanoarchaeota archaeon]
MNRNFIAGTDNYKYNNTFLTAIAQRSTMLNSDLKMDDIVYLADILTWYHKHKLADVSPGIGLEIANNTQLKDRVCLDIFYGTGNLVLVKSAYYLDKSFLSIADTCFLEAKYLSEKLNLKNTREEITRIRTNLDLYSTILFFTINPSAYISNDAGHA